jgi:uncharacterized protein (TIGR04551 family)
LSPKVFLGTAILLLGTQVAEAQMTPGGPMGGGMGPGQTGEEEKKEGVAEEAPKTPGLLPTTPALPPPKGRRKRWKLLEMGGYFRLRTDWFKNFNTGFDDNPDLGGAPFPRALSCAIANGPCDDTLASANMRLRLEPTLNIDEGTSVHIQADVYDNLVLGSTPMGMDLSGYNLSTEPPVRPFSSVQDPERYPQNADRDAITIKRAWAEVAVPLGILKFGRMPNHWGMGVYANGGGEDTINGGYNYDADYGDSVDRVSFSAIIPGTPLRAMVASDWGSTRLVSNQTSANFGHEGHPFDLDDADDQNAWVGVISRLDSPQEFRDTVDRGELALNYGVYFEYKTQSWDDDLTDFTLGGTFDAANRFVPRDLKMYTPDVWAKLGYGPLLLEGEVVGQFGTVKHLDDFGVTGSHNIRKLGGVGRLTWTGVEGKLKLGVEGGFATGDQWDNSIQGRTNVAYAQPFGDPTVCNTQHECTFTQFAFNRDYIVDMILWRRLVGAVTNAAYAKPFLSYDLTKSIRFKVANITSFALKPVATPGNERMYGTEFNGDLGYNGHNLFAGISYGVLFPFAALNHPASDSSSGGPGFPYGNASSTTGDNSGTATTAHTIQMRLILGF